MDDLWSTQPLPCGPAVSTRHGSPSGWDSLTVRHLCQLISAEMYRFFFPFFLKYANDDVGIFILISRNNKSYNDTPWSCLVSKSEKFSVL